MLSIREIADNNVQSRGNWRLALPIHKMMTINGKYMEYNYKNHINQGLFFVQPKLDEDTDGRRCNIYGSCDDIDEKDDEF